MRTALAYIGVTKADMNALLEDLQAARPECPLPRRAACSPSSRRYRTMGSSGKADQSCFLVVCGISAFENNFTKPVCPPLGTRTITGNGWKWVERPMAALNVSSARAPVDYLGFGNQALFSEIERLLAHLASRTVSGGTVEAQSAGEVVAILQLPLQQFLRLLPEFYLKRASANSQVQYRALVHLVGCQ